MPRMTVTARHRDLEGVGFRRYLPENAKVIGDVQQVDEHAQMAIIEVVDSFQAKYVVERLSSGFIGAMKHIDVDGAQAYIDTWK